MVLTKNVILVEKQDFVVLVRNFVLAEKLIWRENLILLVLTRKPYLRFGGFVDKKKFVVNQGFAIS